jgi:hypothetical protein
MSLPHFPDGSALEIRLLPHHECVARDPSSGYLAAGSAIRVECYADWWLSHRDTGLEIRVQRKCKRAAPLAVRFTTSPKATVYFPASISPACSFCVVATQNDRPSTIASTFCIFRLPKKSFISLARNSARFNCCARQYWGCLTAKQASTFREVTQSWQLLFLPCRRCSLRPFAEKL